MSSLRNVYLHRDEIYKSFEIKFDLSDSSFVVKKTLNAAIEYLKQFQLSVEKYNLIHENLINKYSKYANSKATGIFWVYCSSKIPPMISSSTHTTNKPASITNTHKPQNSKFTDQGKNVIIHRFTPKDDKSKINRAMDRLKKRFPDDIPENIDINKLLEYVFPSNLKYHCIFANLSYTNSNQILIRRVSFYPTMNFSKLKFLNDQRLRFSGNLKKGEFVADDIDVINDNTVASGASNDFEVTFYIGADGKNKTNFLTEFTEKQDSASKVRSNDIQEWSNYLEWKNKLAKLRIKALKYIGFNFDLSDKKMTFLAILKEGDNIHDLAKAFRSSDSSVYSNIYSTSRYDFELENSSKELDPGIKLEFISFGKPYSATSIDIGKWNSLLKYAKQYMYQNNGSEVANMSVASHIEAIKKRTDKITLVEVDFVLSEFALSWTKQQIRANGFLTDDAEEFLASEFYSDGFIATSQIGDLTLIRRLKRGISDYISGQMVSPRLSKWLFNIKEARPIQQPFKVKRWQNKKLNAKQKQAVEKILEAPDVCLIQGPPGTGKTTVIAEAVYQFVIQHKRVLVASQANLAVDNALERLIANPQIRAIRLGSEKKIASSVSNITEQNVLKNFYTTLVDYIDSEYLEKWDKSEAFLKEAEKDFIELTNLERDIKQIESEQKILRDSIDNIAVNLDYSTIETKLQNNKEKKIQLENLINYCLGVNKDLVIPSSYAYVSELKNKIVCKLDLLRNAGLSLSNINHINEDSEVSVSNFCYSIIKLSIEADKLLNKIQRSTSAELKQLRENEKLLRTKMELDSSLVLKWQEVQKQIRKLEQSIKPIEFSIDEKTLFNVSILRAISTEDEITSLQHILEQAKPSIDEILDDTIQAAKIYIKNYETTIASLEKTKIKYHDATAQFRLNIERNTKIKEEKESEQFKLCQKYNLDKSEIITILEGKVQKYKTELFDVARKEDWEDIFRGFKQWVTNIPDYQSEREQYLDAYIDGCNVVGVSCTESSNTLVSKGFKDFDVVIIDEVSKATPPELLISMLKGQKIVLVGDHRQLPPLFNEHENSYEEIVEMQSEYDDISVPLKMEDFEKYKEMVTSSLFQQYFECADSSIKETLTDQYRMHDDIMNIVNSFYDGLLEDGNVKAKTGDEKNHNLTIESVIGTKMIVPEKHAYWIDSSRLNDQEMYEQREQGSTSALNIVEAYIIKELLKKIELQYSNDKTLNGRTVSVGVISFYALQVEYLQKLIQVESFHSIDVEINTVDRFQGKEKEIILVSLVRNNPRTRHNVNSFIASFQRINVAFSRAQNLLVIIGSKSMYANQPVAITDMNNGESKIVNVYGDIISKLNMAGTLFYADDVIPEQTAIEVIEEYRKGGNSI